MTLLFGDGFFRESFRLIVFTFSFFVVREEEAYANESLRIKNENYVYLVDAGTRRANDDG